MMEYTKSRVTVTDIFGKKHVGDWLEPGGEVSLDDARGYLMKTEGRVIIKQDSELRVFDQYAYFDVELA